MEKIEKQKCPFCLKDTLTLTEDEQDIPYFGKIFIFSMNCSNCHYQKSDIESAEMKDPSRHTFEMETKKDLNVRVVKSSTATVKVPTLKMSMEPGPASEGFVTNIEGLLQRFKRIIEDERDNTDEDDVRKAAKNLLKKLWKAELGEQKIKIVIEDPAGNSAIISEKTKVEKIKAK
ncbi:MAG: ZPR1 zinc finger domain-containing protein [Candidatus Nanoarchaeia archaeon]|nr:ZPR1 zinc finger domain-containing protein [Candidatus Nanoarchaeia archaeon]